MASKILKGTMILAFGSILSRIIGIIYVIPFNNIVGKEGQALYIYSYIPYTIFISLSTIGFPQAVSKLTAKYNALGEYRLSRKIFHSGQVLMLVMGFSAFLILYILAPFIAKLYNSPKFLVTDIAFVIRIVGTALIIIPSLSFIRGFFQGHGQMLPSSISQIIEQIVRVAVLLIGVKLFIEKGIVKAIGAATTAAFFSALSALLVMFYFWYKNRAEFAALLAKDRGKLNISPKKIFKEMFFSSIPFVIVALALPAVQLIDGFTINTLFSSVGSKDLGEKFLAINNYQVQQLIMIPMTLATAMQISIVPNISQTAAVSDFKTLKKQINEIILIMLFFLVPATFSMSVISKALYTSFYTYNELGVLVLKIAAPGIIVFAFFTVTSAVLQGLNCQKFLIKSLAIGLVVKLITNIVFFRLIGQFGIILATAFGYGTIATLNIIAIKRQIYFDVNILLRRALLICVMTIITLIIVSGVYLLSTTFISPINQKSAPIILLICVPIGVLVYMYLALYTGLFHIMFKRQNNKILKHFKKGNT